MTTDEKLTGDRPHHVITLNDTQKPTPATATKSRVKTRLAVITTTALIAAGAGWAGAKITSPPPPPATEVTKTTITATTGQLQQTLQAHSAATWTGAKAHTPTMTGVVTKRHLDGVHTIKSGTKLFDVNLIPVIAAKGTVPSFRELRYTPTPPEPPNPDGTAPEQANTPTAEAPEPMFGADVQQLQNYLRAIGKRRTPANGSYDAATANQVKAWQKATKQPQTGTVPAGQFMYLPELPVTGYLAPNIRIGATPDSPDPAPAQGNSDQPALTGLVVLPATPEFAIPLSKQQAALVTEGMTATVQHGETTWEARITELRPDNSEGERILAILAGTSTPAVCGNQCDLIPPNGESHLPATIQTLPLTEGVLIPTTALTINTEGQRIVTLADGTEKQVTVTASLGGEAIIDGVTAGTTLTVTTEQS